MELPEGQIDVWFFDIDRAPSEAEARVLSAEERARAARFVRQDLGQRFTVGRGRLRAILSGYLDIPAEQIVLDEAGNRKPIVVNPGAKPIDFSMAHSEGAGMLAVAMGRSVGADIEVPSRLRDVDQLVCHVLDEEEFEAFRALSPTEREEQFYVAWTRKEAVLKASGHGLSIPMPSIHVWPRATQVELRQERTEIVKHWEILEVPVAAGTHAAIAYEAGPARPEVRRPH